MKKIILLIVLLTLVGCTEKADIVCTEKNELYTSTIKLYFKNDKLTEASSVSEYKDEDLAKQVCSSLGEKVKCYKNKIEIVDFMNDYIGEEKSLIIKNMESQDLTCK